MLAIFLIGCVQLGSMGVKVETEGGQTVFDSGSTVKFKVVMPEGHRFKRGTVKILNEMGEQVLFMDMPESLEFSHQFPLAGEYVVSVGSGSQKDYGYSQLPISINYAGTELNWSLATNHNKTSLMGEENSEEGKVDFDLTFFFEGELKEKSITSMSFSTTRRLVLLECLT